MRRRRTHDTTTPASRSAPPTSSWAIVQVATNAANRGAEEAAAGSQPHVPPPQSCCRPGPSARSGRRCGRSAGTQPTAAAKRMGPSARRPLPGAAARGPVLRGRRAEPRRPPGGVPAAAGARPAPAGRPRPSRSARRARAGSHQWRWTWLSPRSPPPARDALPRRDCRTVRADPGDVDANARIFTEIPSQVSTRTALPGPSMGR